LKRVDLAGFSSVFLQIGLTAVKGYLQPNERLPDDPVNAVREDAGYPGAVKGRRVISSIFSPTNTRGFCGQI
jgi:hypothetical protein